MAIVSRRPRRADDIEDAESVMTAAAGGLRQRFMRKVAEISHGRSNSSGSDTSSSESENDEANPDKRKKKRVKKLSTSSTATASSPVDLAVPVGAMEMKKTEAQKVKDEEENKKKSGGIIGQGVGLRQLEQAVPADAQMAPGMVEKVDFTTARIVDANIS
jgi:metal transporter CNNM